MHHELSNELGPQEIKKYSKNLKIGSTKPPILKNNLVIAVKKYANADIKVLQPWPISLFFLNLLQIFCPVLQMCTIQNMCDRNISKCVKWQPQLLLLIVKGSKQRSTERWRFQDLVFSHSMLERVTYKVTYIITLGTKYIYYININMLIIFIIGFKVELSPSKKFALFTSMNVL